MKLPERKFFNLKGAMHFLLLFVCVAALGTATLAQKSRTFADIRGVDTKAPAIQTEIQPEADSPTPTYSDPSNLTCQELVGLRNQAGALLFPGLTAGTHEFKYGDSNSNYNFGPHAFQVSTHNETGFGPVVVDTNAFTDRTITFSMTQSAQTHTLNSFSSQVGISAVIFKLGNTSYAYDFSSVFPGYVYTGGPITKMDQNGFSHIIFCFETSPRPTAADVSVSGRVLTSEGRAVSGARITITNAATGQVYAAITNPFGYYTIEALDSDAFYVARVGKKGMKFVEDTKTFSLVDSMADLDFVTTAP
jgi:hypothetical protein